MKKILISGGNGNFAKQIIKYNQEYDVSAPSHKEMDITVLKEVENYILETSPDIFLHAAAYTRPMDGHQINPDISLETNIIGTSNVSLACMKHKVKLVYISTDYVYPGKAGNYKEDSPLSPYIGKDDGMTKYGWSKLGGECAVRMCENSLILRICMCDDPFPHSQAIIDVKKSLIYNSEAAKIVLKLLDECGVINVGGPPMSVYDFVSNRNPNIDKISRCDILDVDIAPDTTMDVSKMKRILWSKNKNE